MGDAGRAVADAAQALSSGCALYKPYFSCQERRSEGANTTRASIPQGTQLRAQLCNKSSLTLPHLHTGEPSKVFWGELCLFFELVFPLHQALRVNAHDNMAPGITA